MCIFCSPGRQNGPLGLLARPKRFSEGFSVRVASEEVAIKVYKMASKAVNSSEEPAGTESVSLLLVCDCLFAANPPGDVQPSAVARGSLRTPGGKNTHKPPGTTAALLPTNSHVQALGFSPPFLLSMTECD